MRWWAVLAVAILQIHIAEALIVPGGRLQSVRAGTVRLQSSVALAGFSAPRWNDFMAKPVDPGLHLKIKGKTLNVWGLMYAAITMFVTCSILPFMMAAAAISDATGNGARRRSVDWLVHYWAKMSLNMGLCFPRLLGRENLPPLNETVVFVPNHTSFIDILVMSGFVPRPFKYLSKSEIADIPVIGKAMKLAQHVFLKRDDLRSTLDCTDQVVQRLCNGNSMVLFPEGTRSSDGRLAKFKKGAFQMAKSAGVRVVPISIGNLHRWMPPTALLPLAPIRGVYVMVHPPISTADKTIKEVREAAEAAVNGGLPVFQQQRLA